MEFLSIKHKDKVYEIVFEGFKVFQTKDPNLFSRDLNDMAERGMFSNVGIFREQVMLISDFTKTSAFFNFSKNSEFTKMVIDRMINNILFNNEASTKIINQINDIFGFEILEENLNIYKLVNNIFAIKEDDYLNKDTFIKILKSNLINKKMTFILNDISWLNYNDVVPFLNNHNFIFVTNDFRKNIKAISQIESVVLLSETILEIDSKDKLVAFIEKRMNTFIDPKTLTNFFNFSDDKTSAEIYANLINF